MYFGISFQTQMRSQSQIARIMMAIGSTHLPIRSSRSGAHAARLLRVELQRGLSSMAVMMRSAG